MKKIIPFKKDFLLKTNISEIVSIALDHELNVKDRNVIGNLIISGSYKINETSVNVEEFKYNIPVNIEMSDHYIIDNMDISIEDFYYEIVNNNTLSIDIKILLDKIEEVLIPFKPKEEIKQVSLENEIKQVSLENEIKQEDIKEEERNNLIDNITNPNENYLTYHIYIIKENDNIENIILKYNITKEILEQYNDITNIKIGDKLIIPALYESNK